MAFRFKLDEPIQKGFRRIGSEQIDRALAELGAGSDLAREIHEARKCLKRVRALLRLGRAGLGNEVFRAENRCFGDIARRLGPARDDHVIRETLLKLEAAQEDDAGRGALRRLSVAILSESSDGAGVDPETLAGAKTDLIAARERFRRLEIKPATRATLIVGVEQGYRQGRKAMGLAYDTADDEAFHAWRKGVQAHWRHMVLLSRLWPEMVDARAAAARELSQILGDDHDLSLVRIRIDALGKDIPTPSDVRSQVLALVAGRQDVLRRLAKPRGALLYAASPKIHGRWLAALWEAQADKAEADKAAEKAGVIALQAPKNLVSSKA